MTSVADARAAMLATIELLAAEQIPLGDARGRVLAQDIVAPRDQPPFAASAMDGYALSAADTPGVLRIVGESAAGHGFERALRQGEAVRISTGAPMPEGADCVLIQEDARVEDQMLHAGGLTPGAHVRAAGCDFAEGARLLEKGRLLDEVALALAATAGAAQINVAKRPRVHILSGGDEIVALGETPRADQIYDSCSYGVAALVARWGGNVGGKTLLSDDAASVEHAAAQALADADLVVCIGAASVGPHDHAKPALAKLGAQFVFRKVDVRPGKPTWFATVGDTPVLGLPGNPASALVTAALFLRPLLLRLQGAPLPIEFSHARLVHDVPSNGPREAYLRARASIDSAAHLILDASADQDSSLLSVFAQANALLVRPANAPAAKKGDIVPFLAWPDGKVFA